MHVSNHSPGTICKARQSDTEAECDLLNIMQVDLEPAALKVAGNAGLSQQSEAVQRLFEVIYLDEQVRVVRFLPDRDSDSQPQLFVFERIPTGAEDDEEVSISESLAPH